MREIKFRAWDKLHKRLADVASIDFLSGVAMLDDSEDIWRIGFGDIVMEQYTGLHDKNGKKIFEGDILKTRKGTIQEVVSLIGNFDGNNMTSQFTCFCAGWQNVNPSDVKGWYFSKTDEVIGNIHENADLLEEK